MERLMMAKGGRSFLCLILLPLAATALATTPSATTTSSSTPLAIGTAKHDLFDVPVSNNGARCRIILYKKEIPMSEVNIVSPMVELGGLKSPEYLAISPQGLMPALTCSETGLNLCESDTIARYLLSRYNNQGGPSFQPDNPQSNQIARLHDMYLTTIQGCMYKAQGPFGKFWTRKDALADYQKQLKVIENLIHNDDSSSSTYLCGDEVSLADATLFPSLVFATRILPKFVNDDGNCIPPKLSKWFDNLKVNDAAFARVYNEMASALDKWEDNNRWDAILGAGGWRDEDDEPTATLFDKIISGDIPADIVPQDDDKVLAFKDIHPAAPAHVLVIPKDRNGLTRLTKATVNEHVEILGRLLVAAGNIARDTSLGFGDDGGARIVINDGPEGGQEIMHLHVHVLGGRQMTWPPG